MTSLCHFIYLLPIHTSRLDVSVIPALCHSLYLSTITFHAFSAAGYNYCGSEPLYSGISGKVMQAEIFIGVVYYQRLRYNYTNICLIMLDTERNIRPFTRVYANIIQQN